MSDLFQVDSLVRWEMGKPLHRLTCMPYSKRVSEQRAESDIGKLTTVPEGLYARFGNGKSSQHHAV